MGNRSSGPSSFAMAGIDVPFIIVAREQRRERLPGQVLAQSSFICPVRRISANRRRAMNKLSESDVISLPSTLVRGSVLRSQTVEGPVLQARRRVWQSTAFSSALGTMATMRLSPTVWSPDEAALTDGSSQTVASTRQAARRPSPARRPSATSRMPPASPSGCRPMLAGCRACGSPSASSMPA